MAAALGQGRRFDMNFTRSERISLKLHPELNEKWVQELIASDPSILGLGELVLRDKERIQPRAGRLDLLLQDPETKRRYEVELQLGPTDEAHIVRTIEYWDIERKRYPQYDHCAVLIAEDITSRFLNVVALFNGTIPLIAQAHVVVDRDKASALGVTAQAVESALYSAYGQRLVSPIYTANNQYWVVVQVQERFQSDPDMLSELYIHSSRGELVPLSALSKFTTGVGPLTVNHTGQLPSVTISFNLRNGVALGDAVNEIKNISNSTLPISIAGSFQGTAQAFQQSLTGLGILLIATVAVIYIVLGILYESFIHPITILTGLPAAAFGGLATLSLFHMPLDIYGFVGLVMLIGIVKKNAIMMIDFSLELERKENYSVNESAYHASLIRFRPIMMTSACTIMGTLPIAIGIGANAGALRSLGLCVVGGLIFGQIVTLYITPVFYTYMGALLKWLHPDQSAADEESDAEEVLAPLGEQRTRS